MPCAHATDFPQPCHCRAGTAPARTPASGDRGPVARARLNSVFIATFFIGGALGSQAGSVAYHAGGWTAVTALGAALPLLALLYWTTERAPGSPRVTRRRTSS